ncbi:MAG: hypothetical protein N3B14_08675 [Thermoleophilia bacterium]|nr:hypothetical protein [Thermoleophilia bacterium]
MKVREVIRHKWVVPVAALVLVLAIGAGAWAATGSNEASQDNSTASNGAVTTEERLALGADLGLGELFGPGHVRGLRGMGNPEQAEQMRERMQRRVEAMLDLLRDKMSPEDQATFDNLMAQREAQQEALKKALEELRSTNQKLRDLIDKYLVPEESSTSTTSL